METTFGAEYLESPEAGARGGRAPKTPGEISTNLQFLDCLTGSANPALCLNGYGY